MSQKISSRWHFHISAYKCQEASWVHKSWVPGEAIRMGVWSAAGGEITAVTTTGCSAVRLGSSAALESFLGLVWRLWRFGYIPSWPIPKCSFKKRKQKKKME